MNFYQFWDKLNGKPYEEDVPPPVDYKMSSYSQSISTNPINNSENSGGYDLRPLTPEDMSSASAEDVARDYARIHKGKNPTRLGKPMTDEELAKFYGHTW